MHDRPWDHYTLSSPSPYRRTACVFACCIHPSATRSTTPFDWCFLTGLTSICTSLEPSSSAVTLCFKSPMTDSWSDLKMRLSSAIRWIISATVFKTPCVLAYLVLDNTRLESSTRVILQKQNWFRCLITSSEERLINWVCDQRYVLVLARMLRNMLCKMCTSLDASPALELSADRDWSSTCFASFITVPSSWSTQWVADSATTSSWDDVSTPRYSENYSCYVSDPSPTTRWCRLSSLNGF